LAEQRRDPAVVLAGHLQAILPFLVIVTVLVAMVTVWQPASLGGVLRVALVVFGLLGLWVLHRLVGAIYPVSSDSVFRYALRPLARAVTRPDELQRVTGMLRFAAASATDTHYRLRPALQEIAAHRLAVRRGVDLDAQPEEAAAIVGAAAWELLRPDRAAPTHRHGPGIDTTTLRDVLARLEET